MLVPGLHDARALQGKSGKNGDEEEGTSKKKKNRVSSFAFTPPMLQADQLQVVLRLDSLRRTRQLGTYFILHPTSLRNNSAQLDRPRRVVGGRHLADVAQELGVLAL